MSDDKLRVLTGLRENMIACGMDCGFGMNNPSYEHESGVMGFLKEARELGLTWGDFDEYHVSMVELEKEESVSRIKKRGLEIVLAEGESADKLILFPNGKGVEVDRDMTLGDFYDGIMSERVSYIVKGAEAGEKFSRKKEISVDDYLKASNYF